MGVEFSGNVVVSGDADKVYEFVEKHTALPYGYEALENDGYYAITFFNHKGDFEVDFWKRTSKCYPELKFVAKYQQELAAAYICTIQSGKLINHTCFDWNNGDIHTWSD